ncbi:MAG TPA: response regulator [Phycisphaerae bacterium]|nr:response regulator [Phycisphaerae bacterium]
MSGELDGKTVLLVDDDRDILSAMQAALSDLGPEIVTAVNGDEALLQAAGHSPDLVILDMMLPKRGGLVVLEKLKRGKKRGDFPRVIMVTGNQGHRHKTYAEGLGVDGYLNKPFHMERLIEAVRKLLT